MTIQVTKEPINLREKLNELETNKGLKGNEILQAETAQEVRSLIGAGRKNLIINGGFDVWQRGTSGTTGFIADRWYVAHSSATTKDGNSLKMVASSTDPYLIYNVEDVGMRLADKTVTLSFLLKTSTGNNTVQYVTYSGSGAKSTTTGIVDADGFQKHTVTFTLDSTSYTDRHRLIFELEPTSGITIWIKEVQLELGSVATDFEHRSYGEELALCQRYYQQSYTDGTTAGTTTDVGAHHLRTGVSSSNSYITIEFQEAMRVIPSVKLYGTTAATNAVGNWRRSGDNAMLSYVSYVNEKRMSVSFSTTENIFVSGHFTADAEL